ncbi:MAG: hypothetical protein SWE60_01215 [Thermodesulfobacteriota bacterium]|nr:hypothetical protein [Thermodesulfobacteriota bacterium]
MAEANTRGAWVLEDACQALLSEFVGDHAEFLVYSPRKYVGGPDGGILVINCQKDFGELNLEAVPPQWWLRSFSATVLRREFDSYGGNRSCFHIFKRVEKEQPIGPHTMSDLSKPLFTSVFDYRSIAEQRVRNYHVLLHELGHLAVFPDVSNHVVPLGFPIHVGDRDQVRQALFDHHIRRSIGK